MALGAIVDVGHNMVTANVNSVTLTGVNAAIGDKLVFGAGGGNSTGAVTFSDSSGNTWTTDIDGTGVPGVHQGSCDVTVALVAGTVTATWSTTVNTDYMIAGVSFSGAAAGIGSATPASTTNTVAAWRGALSFTTAGASERVIQFGVRAAATTSAAAGSNTEVHDFNDGARSMSSVYQDVAAGSVANGGTWTSAGTWRACGASYAAASGGTNVTVNSVPATATGSNVAPAPRIDLPAAFAAATGSALASTPTLAVPVTFAVATATAPAPTILTGLVVSAAPAAAIAAGTVATPRIAITSIPAAAIAAGLAPTITTGATVTITGGFDHGDPAGGFDHTDPAGGFDATAVGAGFDRSQP